MEIGAPILSAIACAILADSKGRNSLGWFFIGLIFNLFGVVLVLVVGDLKDEERNTDRQSDHTRRVEEQLRQERGRREELEREVQVARQRIDLHDQALGLETRPLDPPPPRDDRYLDGQGPAREPWVGA